MRHILVGLRVYTESIATAGYVSPNGYLLLPSMYFPLSYLSPQLVPVSVVQ